MSEQEPEGPAVYAHAGIASASGGAGPEDTSSDSEETADGRMD
jgi:hypothetical protein